MSMIEEVMKYVFKTLLTTATEEAKPITVTDLIFIIGKPEASYDKVSIALKRLVDAKVVNRKKVKSPSGQWAWGYWATKKTDNTTATVRGAVYRTVPYSDDAPVYLRGAQAAINNIHPLADDIQDHWVDGDLGKLKDAIVRLQHGIYQIESCVKQQLYLNLTPK